MNLALRISLLAAALLVAGSPLSAQTARPERPYRGLFASNVGDAEQLLTLSLSLGGGYDDNVFAEEGFSQDPRTAKAGRFGSLSGDLAYSFKRPRVTAELSVGTIARYRPTSGPADPLYASYSGAAGMAVDLWRGSRLSATHSIAYQPYFVFGLYPSLDRGVAEPAIAPPEFAAVSDDNVSHSTGADLSQQVSRRGSLGFSYSQQITDFSGDRADFTSRGAAAQYTHNVAKGLGLRVGYGYRESDSQQSVSAPVRVHNIDAGVDFNRALSVSRRTVLSFGTGSSAVSDATHTSYHLTGKALLRHEIGRTWSAALGYDRSVQFVDVLSESFLADAAAFAFGGMVSRRLEFHSRAGVSFAHGSTQGIGGFDTYLGTAGVSYAFTRNIAVGLDYSYYRYEFAQGAVLPSGFSRQVDRQSVRAHLSLWAPLVHRARRPDAAR